MSITKEIDYDEKYIAAIDLGSSKIAVCVALVQGREPHIVYYKETPSAGIQSSTIFIPMKTAGIVKKAFAEAEKELDIEIKQVVVGMPRSDVMQVTASATMQRENPGEYISAEEVQTIKAMALATYPLPYPDKQAIYGAVAQSFTIEEGMELVEQDVVGTLSPTLEGNFKVFVGRKKAHDSLDKIFAGLGIEIARRYFVPEVTPASVLSKEELKNGVALVDIGAGVTSVSIYRGNIMRYYESIPFGGASVTGDIETECSLDDDLAEKIKKRFGACMPDKLGEDKDKILQIRLTDPYVEIPVKYISEIVTARYKELVDAILFHIQESGLQNRLRGGIVLTGGASKQKNLDLLFKEMSGFNVRRGYPKRRISAPAGSGFYTPSATAAVGMILAALDDDVPDCAVAPVKEPPKEDEMVKVIVTSQTPSLPDGQLIDPDEFGKVEPGIKQTTVKVPLPGKKPSGGEEDEPKEKQGVIALVWETVGNKLLKWYDEMNK